MLITFETLHVSSHAFYYTMNWEEFLNFDEALFMISRGNLQGNIPIGDKMWFTYFHNQYDYEIKLCKEKRNKFIHFDFDYNSFQEYKKTVHWKLLSFLRLNATEYDGRRKRWKKNQYESQHIKSFNGKRPFSDENTRANKFTRNGPSCERESTLGTTNDVNMSLVNKTSPILPKRCNSTSRRKNKSFVNDESDRDDLPDPEEVQLLNRSLSSEMDLQ